MILAFVTLAVVINSAGTIGVARDQLLTSSQRFAQILLIWLMPVVGAIVTLAVRRAQKQNASPTNSEPWTTISDNQAIDYALSQNNSSESSNI